MILSLAGWLAGRSARLARNLRGNLQHDHEGEMFAYSTNNVGQEAFSRPRRPPRWRDLKLVVAAGAPPKPLVTGHHP